MVGPRCFDVGIALQVCRIGGNVGYRQQFAKLLHEFRTMCRGILAGRLRRLLRRYRGCQTKKKRSKVGKFHRLTDYTMRLVQMFLPAFLQNRTSSKNMWTDANEGRKNQESLWRFE